MLKNKIIVRKIRNIVILLMAIIIMIGAYKNIDRSRAEDVIEIGAKAIDNYGYLADEQFILEAKQTEEDLYEIELPEAINGKKINRIVKISLEDIEGTTEQAPEPEVEEIVAEGNKIYLTEEQKENHEINIEVEYDIAILNQNEDGTYSKTLLTEKSEEERKQLKEAQDAKMLYSKILKHEDKENNKMVELKGYLPVNAELQVEQVTKEKLEEIFKDKHSKVDVAYDIKILEKVVTQVPTDEADPTAQPEEIIETIEINPEDFGEKCEVSIKDAKIDKESQVYHVKEDNTYEEVKVKENEEGDISFEAETFSIYAIVSDELTTTITDTSTVAEEEANPYIPTGFTHVSGTSLSNGFVVQDPSGNQYTWVPVPRTTTVYPNAGLNITAFTDAEYNLIQYDLAQYSYLGYDPDMWTSQSLTGMTEEQYYTKKKIMLKSIYLNGGFYVGRYETGTSSGNYHKPSTTLETPVIKQNTWPYINVTSSESQTLAQSFAANLAGYESSMMFEVQWYLMLKYLDDNYGGVFTSTTNDWGNNYNTTFSIDANAKYTTDGGVTIKNGPKTKNSGEPIIISTGAVSSFSRRNISDVLGNVWERTLGRGPTVTNGLRAYGTSYWDSWEHGASAPWILENDLNQSTRENVGFRVSLYFDGKNDTTPPTATSLTSSAIATNQNTITLYINNPTDIGGTGVARASIHGRFVEESGIINKNINIAKEATWDATNNRFYATFSFNELPNTETGQTNQGDGTYLFDAHVFDGAGNDGYIAPIYVQYDTTAPIIEYEYANTTIVGGDVETVTVVFDVTDKNFASTTLSNLDASQITIGVDDYDVTELNNYLNTNNRKQLTKQKDIYYDSTAGKTYVNSGTTGTGKKVGERYQLVISGLDKGDGFKYSGYMTLSFAAGTITDTSSNTSDAKIITIGVNDVGNGDPILEIADYTKPYLPAGYTHVEGTNLSNGLTIQDSKGNQYVWVEVPTNLYDNASYNTQTTTGDRKPSSSEDYADIEYCLHKYTATYRASGYTDTFYSTDQHGFANADEYNTLKYKMLKSIYENGGFYVGRYETGIADTEPNVAETNHEARTSNSQDIADYTPVIQANAYPYNYVTNKQAQELAESFATAGYETSLMFGVQWDLMLKYLETKGTSETLLKTDSKSFGNYNISTWTITNTRAKHSTNYGSSWNDWLSMTKIQGTQILLSTGSSDTFCKQNIYDFAGNCWEWTLEYSSNSTYSTVNRGGNYYDGRNAIERFNGDTIGGNDGVTFRVSLYRDEDVATSEGSGTPEIVDVVDPAWSIENVVKDKTNEKVTFDLLIKDKYIKESTIEEEDIAIYVDGTNVTNLDNVNLTLGEGTAISGTRKNAAGETETVTIGYKYAVTVDNWIEALRQTGKLYKEWSGTTKIVIPGGKATDESGNTSKEQEITVGLVDFIKPEFTYIYSGTTRDTESSANPDINYNTKTLKVVFSVVDKYFDYDNTKTATDYLNVNDLSILIDGQQPEWRTAGKTTGVTRTLTGTPITDTRKNATGVTETATIGFEYTLLLSNIEQNPNDGLNYSGIVTIGIPAGKIEDKSDNTNDAQTITVGMDIPVSLPSTPYTTPYLPAGYTHVAGTNLSNGLTIQDGLGNQYVWVEVPTSLYDNASYNTQTTTGDRKPASNEDYGDIEYCLQQYTTTYRDTSYKDEFYSTLQYGFTDANAYNAHKNKMLKSVYENGGFYVGKYETGIADSEPDVIDTTVEARTASGDTTQTPVIQANAYPYNFVTAKQSQELAKSFATTGYETSLMFGVQWDLILKHLETKNAATTSELNSNSTSWGNYNNNIWTIENENVKYSDDYGVSWEDGINMTNQGETLLSTGASSDFSKMGIYDLAGNTWEWTLESYSSNYCVVRGGSSDHNGSDYPASSRNMYDTYVVYYDFGFRTALWEDVDMNPDNGSGGSGTPEIVDVVDPAWSIENVVKDKTNEKVTFDLLIKDKYIKQSTIEEEDIAIYVDGTNVTNLDYVNLTLGEGTAISGTRKNATGETETVTIGYKYAVTVDDWEELLRQTGKLYKEWSGTTKIVIPGGKATDESGNTSKEQELTIGLVDYIKPEFTYEYANTTIVRGDVETVTIVFDVADRNFASTTLSNLNASQITVSVDNYDVTELNNYLNTNNRKKLTKLKDIYYDATAGTTYVNSGATGNGSKVGERYQLVISGLDQGDAFKYSGYMTLSFAAGTITDTSSNTSDAKIITIGVDDTGDVNGTSPSELFDSEVTNADGLHIGDFVNYDAGTWTAEEIAEIQTGLASSLMPANNSTILPNGSFQFGGFTAGSSRNGNATPYDSSYNYIKNEKGDAITGWRVFDISDDGTVTLISAGNPEDYNAGTPLGMNMYISEYIVTGKVNSGWTTANPSSYVVRDWNDYVNSAQKATSATMLTKSMLDTWYGKYTGAGTTADTSSTTLFQKIYSDPYTTYQSLVDNNSYYTFSSASQSRTVYNFLPSLRSVDNLSITGKALGVRILVTLDSSVLFSTEKVGTTTLSGGNMNTYGGAQTYNVWDIVGGTGSGSGTGTPEIVDVVDPIWTIEEGEGNYTYKLQAQDKYFASSNLTGGNIQVYVDGQLTNVVATVGTKTDIKEDRDGDGVEETKIGEEYIVTLSDPAGGGGLLAGGQFVEFTDVNTGVQSKYRNKSAKIELKIAAGTITDQSTNTSNEQTLSANTATDISKPEVIYKYAETTVDPINNQITVIFDITDVDYASSTLAASHITAKIGETTITSKTMTSADLTASINGTNKVVGKRYTLVLKPGEKTGKVTIDIPAGKVTDASGQANENQTITVGINMPELTGSAVTIDLTNPTVTATPDKTTNDSANDYVKNQAVTITLSDDYSGLVSATRQYFLATSTSPTSVPTDTSLSGTYTSGTQFTIGTNLTGTYYLFVKVVEDNAGNISTANGTVVTVAGTKYHRFGTYKFDNTRPYWETGIPNISTTNKNVTIDIIGKDDHSGYGSDSLDIDDIEVWVEGTKITNVTKNLSTATTVTGGIKYTLTLTNFEETLRQTGKAYKEWSGSTKIVIPANTLQDNLANKNTSKEVSLGHVDIVNPEFTYKYSDTTIVRGDVETVTVVFDVTDKYFASTTLATDTLASLINVKVDNEIANSNITKALTKKTIAQDTTQNGVTYKTNGDIYNTVNGEIVKVGERYQLTISNLDKGDGFKYSGAMTLSFGKGVATDESGNTNNGTTITIGIDQPQDLPYIPDGFRYVEGTYDTGIVIADPDDNEYVWVEVPKYAYSSNTLNLDFDSLTGTALEDAYEAIENDLRSYTSDYRTSDVWIDTFTDDQIVKAATGIDTVAKYNELKQKMLKSVFKNGGFYVGRYETGIEDEPKNGDGISGQTPVIKQNSYPYASVTNAESQQLATSTEYFNKTEGYQTSLMFGVQWDLILKYMETKAVERGVDETEIKRELNHSSKNWGNYLSSKYTITNENAKYKGTGTNGMWLSAYGLERTQAEQDASKYWGLTTGASESFKKQNIYDMAGNYYEAVLETKTNSEEKPSASRGQSYYNDGYASCHWEHETTNRGSSFRVMLFKEEDTFASTQEPVIVDVVEPIWTVEEGEGDFTYKLQAKDKFFASSSLTGGNIQVYVNGNLTDATATVGTSTDIIETVNGVDTVVGKEYIVTLSDPAGAGGLLSGGQYIEFTDVNTGVQSKYRDKSSQIELKIAAGTITDQSANTSNEQILSANISTDVSAPEVIYKYAETTVDPINNQITVIFDITDVEYASSTLAASHITAKIGETTITSKTMTSADLTASIGGTNKVVGKRFTLVLKPGEKTGKVTIDIPAGKVTDASGQANENQTITVGINMPELTGSAVTIDLTNPTVTATPDKTTNASANDYVKNQAVTITLSDDYSGVVSTSGQYFLATSTAPTSVPTDTSLSGTYTSGTQFTIGTNLTGTYYLFVTGVEDNAGNISTANGTVVTVAGTKYHRFGTYKFDNTSPYWEIGTPTSADKKVTVDIIGTDDHSGYGADSLDIGDIEVWVEGTKITNVTKSLSTATTVTQGIKYTLTLSNFEEALRQAGKTYKEWSGSTKIVIAANTLQDNLGNKNTSDEYSLGHVDVINPEFTYKYADTTIVRGDVETVTVVFDVTDKYFASTTLSNLNASQITVGVDNYDVTELNNYLNTGSRKALTKLKDVYYDATAGTTYVNSGATGTGRKVGERYQLVISGLDKGDAFKYSGYMTLSFAAGTITDTEGNTSDAKIITIGVDDNGDGTLPSTPYTTPYLPAGYKHVPGTALSNGLTIQDSLGNQYVWVEVPTNLYDSASYNTENTTGDRKPASSTDYADIEYCLHQYTATYRNGTDYTDTFYSTAQHGFADANEYNAHKNKMLKSVYENGGFYVGKYETGIADSEPDVIDTTVEARTVGGDTTQTPVIQANAYPYNYVTSKQAQELSESFATTGYETSLMFGVQWDLVLKHLEAKGSATVSELITDSISWGNYINNLTTDITNTSAKYAEETNDYVGIWVDGAYGQKVSVMEVLLSTGASDDFSKMGIYDLAGNMWEWTLEFATVEGRPITMRGGSGENNNRRAGCIAL